MTSVVPPSLPPWLRRKLRWAGGVLWWERVWRAGWPLANLAGLFLALALLDVLPTLSGAVHAAVLGAFALGAGVALGGMLRCVSRPTLAEAARRLEVASGVAHRPLAALFDRPVGASGASDVWSVHVGRMSLLARRLGPGWPSPGVAARDPLGLRAGVVLLLVIGVVVGGDHAGERLERALSPAFAPEAVAGDPVQMWITPPAYTGQGPMALGSVGPAKALVVPVGSAVLVQVQGGRAVPVLEVNGRSVPFAPLGEASFRLETAIDGGDALEVRQGGRGLARWEMKVLPDHPPVVAFASPPQEGGRGRLKLEVDAADDYGVVAGGALIGRAGEGTVVPTEVPLPLTPAKRVHTGSRVDLTAHPLAGQEVSLRLFARDGNGQTSVSEAVRLRLPERQFFHPVARAVAAQRMALAGPERLAEVLAALDALSAAPEAFADDPVVFLALRVARLRLVYGRSNEAVEAVRDLLWQVAIRLEDGLRADAEREVDDAGRALAEALAEGDSAALEALLERYRAAMTRSLEALSQELAKLDPGALPGGERAVGAEDFSQALDRLRDLIRAGAKDAAQRMLADLQRTLQELHSARIPRPGDQGMKVAREAMQALNALIERQQELLDDTFAQAHSTRRTVDRERMRTTAQAQEALRRDLGTMMRHLSETGDALPEGFGTAELAMRAAVADLLQGDPTQAAEEQGIALHELKTSTRAALQQMIQRVIGQGGPALFPGTADGDPLGRQGSGGADDGSVRVPSHSETRNARQILDELRRRAGEQDRPQQEHDYLNRLLRQF